MDDFWPQHHMNIDIFWSIVNCNFFHIVVHILIKITGLQTGAGFPMVGTNDEWGKYAVKLKPSITFYIAAKHRCY